ncbi:hypothetical protein PDE_01781 [Penicillium oxalicum 114-2]|uniref:Serine hydrolase domain-containing protein n=1 Tax=Penicillium oxalicum (strain 114-2 / CGMCC 5302) TaxID=933388 RepID=S8AY27_PENO1|nr:hypothetical protein PDE_01781 [Penicillium oxalicum 114-2]
MLLDQRSEKTSSSELRNVQFVYPSGILPANPDHSFDEEPGSMRSWGYGDPRYDQIVGIERAVHHVLAVMETQGPFVGIVGFSSGSAVAAIVTSLLEKRKSICGFRLNSTHPRLKFAAFFSGFQLEHPRYRSIYSTQIETPTLHVIGTLDAMILPSQSLRLVASCDRPEEFHFFGAHYVPRSKALIETFKAYIETIKT